MAIVSIIRDNSELDIYLFSSWPYAGYLFLVLLLSALGWPLLAYCWLQFFKSDVTGFVVLLIFLGTGSFLDVFLSFIQIFAHITNEGLVFESFGSVLLYIIRLVLCIVCPNVTLKRILFNFRLRSSRYCISTLNRILKSNYDLNASFLSFNEPGISIFIGILLFQLIFYVLLLTAIETHALNKAFFKNLFSDLFKSKRIMSSTKKIVIFFLL